MKKAAIIMFFVALINFSVMVILRNQELTGCTGAGCSFAGVSQGLSIIFISLPLFILSGILAITVKIKRKRNLEVAEKINNWSVVIWIISLALVTSVIVPIFI